MEKKPNSEKQTLSEVWFPGTHGSVGGGEYKEKSLSNSALRWMVDEIKEGLSLGLEIDLGNSEDSCHVNHKSPFTNDPEWWYRLLGLKERKIHPNAFTKISESAETRLIDDSLNPRYEPTNLMEYKKELEKLSKKYKDK